MLVPTTVKHGQNNSFPVKNTGNKDDSKQTQIEHEKNSFLQVISSPDKAWQEKKEWRPQCQAVEYSLLCFEFPDKSLLDKVLRFNPIQIAEWLTDLIGSGTANSQAELEEKLGVDKTRIGQFLRLMRLPAQTRARLKEMPHFNEFRLRRIVGNGRSWQAGPD